MTITRDDSQTVAGLGVIAAGGSITGDSTAIDATAIGASVQVSAGNTDGTPVNDDNLDIWIFYSLDDGVTFDTDKHAEYLGRLDTVQEHPAVDTWRINEDATHFALYMENNSTDSNTITGAAEFTEKKG